MEEENQLSILLASSNPFIEESGGVKDFILGLKEALGRHGCKVSVVAPESENAQKKVWLILFWAWVLRLLLIRQNLEPVFPGKKQPAGFYKKLSRTLLLFMNHSYLAWTHHNLFHYKDKRSRAPHYYRTISCQKRGSKLAA